MSEERDCEHGQLARSCNICDYEKDIKILQSALEQIKNRINDGDCDEWTLQALSRRASEALKATG